jgi:hypothetical protein
MLNECIPYYEGPYTQTLTVHVGYAVTGKTFVGPITGYQGAGPGLAADPLPAGDGGNLQCPAAPASGGQVGGVAAWDAASGTKLTLIRGTRTHLPVTAGATVAAGDLLMVDTQGRVVLATTGNLIVGKAHSAATVGVDCVVELFDGFSRVP